MSNAADQTDRLIEAVEHLSDDINGLMQVVEEGTLLKNIVEETSTLRAAIADVRAELEWAARNLTQTFPPRPRPQSITSFPIDPCDPNFAEKVNALSRNDLPPNETPGVQQAPLVSTTTIEAPTGENAPEAPVYCCENPILFWVGDPESPGIYCKSCNFVVAEYGNIVDERQERPNSFRGVPKPQQKTLWPNEKEPEGEPNPETDRPR